MASRVPLRLASLGPTSWRRAPLSHAALQLRFMASAKGMVKPAVSATGRASSNSDPESDPQMRYDQRQQASSVIQPSLNQNSQRQANVNSSQKLAPKPLQFNEGSQQSSATSQLRDAQENRSHLNAQAHTQTSNEYDVVIVGGGVTGTALLYELAHFTGLKSIALLERRKDYAMVSSGPTNNSQTIHCGDIETNYSFSKAKTVKRNADLLRNYASGLPDGLREKCVFKMPKMVLGVGPAECEQIEERYNTFKELFPNMRLLGKQEIRKREPAVVRVSSIEDRPEDIRALAAEGEYSAVNYYSLSHSFIKQALAQGGPNRKIDCLTSTEVRDIHQRPDGSFTVQTNRGPAKAKFVVVAACGYSVLMAHKMGHGLGYSVLPVAGSFYFSRRQVLNGKVYTIQNPKLPFAAVHGDPDVACGLKTRFGPTALPMPFLERYNWGSVKDFVKVINPDMRLVQTYMKMVMESHFRRYALMNVLYEIPKLGTWAFLQDVKKIIPGMRTEDLEYAHGFGGVRPQLVSKDEQKLLLGEGKIDGGNVIFNVTPSPGGTTCLGNAEADMRKICAYLNVDVNDKRFKARLMEGEYPIVA